MLLSGAGAAGRSQRYLGLLRCESSTQRRGTWGRRCRLYIDWEACAWARQRTSVPYSRAQHFSDNGKSSPLRLSTIKTFYLSKFSRQTSRYSATNAVNSFDEVLRAKIALLGWFKCCKRKYFTSYPCRKRHSAGVSAGEKRQGRPRK